MNSNVCVVMTWLFNAYVMHLVSAGLSSPMRETPMTSGWQRKEVGGLNHVETHLVNYSCLHSYHVVCSM